MGSAMYLTSGYPGNEIKIRASSDTLISWKENFQLDNWMVDLRRAKQRRDLHPVAYLAQVIKDYWLKKRDEFEPRVQLTLADLDALEIFIKAGGLVPHPHSGRDNIPEHDLEGVAIARREIMAGKNVFYSASY